MDIKRSYKFRFYPTLQQEEVLAKTFGCTRFIYNHMLKVRTDAWYKEGKRIQYGATSSMLTAMKRSQEYGWLNEVSSVPIQQSLRHLQTAFWNFLTKRSGYPKFKKKVGIQAAEYTTSAFRWNGEELRLAKMDAPLRIRWSRQIPKAAKVTKVTVTKDSANRYFASFLCEDSVSHKPEEGSAIGVDLGITHFAILSTGEKFEGPKIRRKKQKKLAKLQRRLAKKQPGSRNREKARLKVARMHAYMADVRRDHHHKLSTKLIRENQVIAVETLAVNNMMKHPNLAGSIVDAGWNEFMRQLEYKANWYGRTLIGIDRFYPSSKRCNDCGHTVAKLSLNVREWTCTECGTLHDRDVNAARNILAAGLAVSACGESVSPVCI